MPGGGGPGRLAAFGTVEEGGDYANLIVAYGIDDAKNATVALWNCPENANDIRVSWVGLRFFWIFDGALDPNALNAAFG